MRYFRLAKSKFSELSPKRRAAFMLCDGLQKISEPQYLGDAERVMKNMYVDNLDSAETENENITQRRVLNDLLKKRWL